MKIFLISILFIIQSYFGNLLAQVQTSTGQVRGIIDIYDNIILNVYLGIPYAEPPVGNLRFRRPIPKQPWTMPLVANTQPPACIQYYPYKYPWVDWKLGQSENCLFLNIWAPGGSYNHNHNSKPVMFWIYGGGLSSGSNRKEVYDGRVLAALGDVIVVTINYRLGVFGFLSTPSEEAPGNMGLYDMLEALKWVKRNIHAFGGDPNRITVFGQSGGSISTGLLCTSPLTTGLFQRVILESGAPTRLIEDNSYARNLDLALRLAAAVGCAPNNTSMVQDTRSIISCLRNRDARVLAFATDSLNPGSVVTFDYIYGDMLLPINPRLAVLNLQLQNVDVLIGNVQDEGSFELTSTRAEIFGPFGERNPQINKSYGSQIIREELSSTFPAPDAVVQRYLGGLWEYDYYQVREQVYHSYGDYGLFCPNVYFAESYARKGSSVYYYYFNHRPSVTPWAPWMGVAHFSEVPFVFGRPLERAAPYSVFEKELSKEMIYLWTNFAKVGVPNLTWPRFSREKPYVRNFEISSDSSYLKTHFENCEFFRPFFGAL